jgi:hypothetical protein
MGEDVGRAVLVKGRRYLGDQDTEPAGAQQRGFDYR